MRTSQKSPQRSSLRCSDLAPCDTLWCEPRGLCKGLFAAAGDEHLIRAGGYAKGVRAKFRYGVARSEQRVVLNFDPTPFASKQDLPTTTHTEPKSSHK